MVGSGRGARLAGLFLSLILVSGSIYVYVKGERFLEDIRQLLEKKISEKVHEDVRIGGLGGNIFKKAVLKDISFRKDGYSFTFAGAVLEYSIWDLVSKRASIDAAVDITAYLKKGSLIFKDSYKIADDINGRVKITSGTIAIDRLELRLLERFDSYIAGTIGIGDRFDINLLFEIQPFMVGHIQGDIINHQQGLYLDLRVEMEGFFGRKDNGLYSILVDFAGPVDRLRFDGGFKNARSQGLDFNGTYDRTGDILHIGMNLNLGYISAHAADGEMMNIPRLTSVEASLDKAKMIFEIIVAPPEGKMVATGELSKWPLVTAQIRNEHMILYGMDISNIIYMTINTIYAKEGFKRIDLDLHTESTVINYLPFDELEASLWLDPDVLRLIYLKVGDTISAAGGLSLKKDSNMLFLKLSMSDFDISRPFLLSSIDDKPEVSGTMNGELFIEGPLDSLKTKARFEVRDGMLDTLPYKNIILNIKGDGPVLEVSDSRIIREDSYMPIEGTMDMRQIGSERFAENIVISSDENTIIWEGWDISKPGTDNKLSLSRDLSNGVKIGFKAPMNENETDYAVERQTGELGLEYSIPDQDSIIQYKSKENEEFLGMVKKYKF